ncbi:TPA: 30S ribosomal protein S5 [Candidatus Saccharibacteria bacterium]|nr:30S ribosomal protein S5 [Candidatus Saccharibacteria bacterium]HIO87383.1 30S ribosomal protein S5 [Candidatus Saccharibacteria bacterium]
MADNRRQNRRDDRPVSEFTENVINIDRVARVVKGGRRFRFRALVVVGDNKTRVGVGVSKGQDVQLAVAKAVDVAKKNMITVPIKDGTIPHTIQKKHAGAVVLLKPARPGTGTIAGGTVRSIIDVIGVKNILSKSLGSSNKINVAYATIDALKALQPKENWVTTLDEPTEKKKTKATKAKAEAK